MPLDTKSIDSSSDQDQAQLGVDASVLKDVTVQGAEAFQEGYVLRLEIEGSPEPILFKPKPETIFGRRDPATGAMPDIDLTPFAGYRMGVSRRHAAIRFGEGQTLELWDLGSSNGTYLNGQRLSAHRPYRLHDADEIRLGQMVIQLYYQPQKKQAADSQDAAAPEAPSSKPAQPSAGQPAGAKPTGAKPAESKPTEAKPAEAKPDKPKAVPGSDKAADAKPAASPAAAQPPAKSEPAKPQPSTEQPKSTEQSPPEQSDAKAEDKDSKAQNAGGEAGEAGESGESKDKPKPPEEK